jgi:PST family polysaccharide transporter
VTVLLGEQWLDVIVPFQIFSLILMLRTSYKLGHSLSRALGAVYATAWRQWVYAAAVLAGAWLGHFSGLTGVAVGVAMAIAINYVLTLHLSLKLIGGSWGDVGVAHFRSLSIGSLVGLTVLGLKTVIAAHGASPIWVLLGASSGAALMLVFLWITCRGIFGEEGVWLRSNFSRQLGLLMGRSI